MHFSAPFSADEIPQVPLCFHQDKQGFLWIGTTDGLYRYDGREVREFRRTLPDTFSIPNNYVRAITEDHEGNIWVGTNGGVASYNASLERFEHLSDAAAPQGKILHLMIDHKNKLWISTYNGLFQYNPSVGGLRNFLPDPADKYSSLSNKTVWSTYEDSRQRIWVATHLGFTVFNNDDRYRFRAFFGDWTQEEGLITDRVFCFNEQPVGTLWLGTHDGLFQLNEHADTFTFRRFHTDGPEGGELTYNFVEDLASQGKNKMWVATYQGGLNEYSIQDSSGQRIRVKHYRPSSLTGSLGSGEIQAVFSDDQGLLWVATNRRVELGKPFRQNFSTIGAREGLEGHIVKVLYNDSFGNLWVGHNDGLSFLSAANRKTQNYKFRHYVHEEGSPNSISDNNITNITEDKQGNLWVMTFKGGLNYTRLEDFATHEKFHLLNKKGLRDYNPINDMVEYAPGEFYIASAHGFARLTFLDGGPSYSGRSRFTASYFKASDRIESTATLDPGIVNTTSDGIQQDRYGDYWVGTYSGIARIRVVDEETLFDNYISEKGVEGSLSNNSFRCFFLDSKGRLWIGTRSGLNLALQKDQNSRVRFRTFGGEDGFENDVIHAIQEDRQGHLWLSTNRGLVQFDPDVAPGKSPVIRTFTQTDGLPANSYVYRSSTIDAEGRLYFGTAKGVAVFHPDSFTINNRPPTLRFTKLSILNKEIRPNDAPGSLLTNSIVSTESITLSHDQNIITLHFAALNYLQPERNQYMYRFSALGENWINTGTRNQLTFTNIPAGVHTLEVKGSNNDGVWQEVPLRLTIRMLPPPWRTWWAYLLYAVSFFALVYFGFRYRLDRRVAKIKALAAVEQAKLETRRQVRDRNAADFHDELGHRLTKIMLFTELAERENNTPSVKKHLQKIKGDAKGLSSGIRDLIWSLDTQQDTLFATSLRLQEFGDHLFESTTIIFETVGIDEAMNDVPMSPDKRKHCLLLFKEAMNNCLKYSQATKALLNFNCMEERITIALSDDGVGFSSNQDTKGYGLHNMQERAQKMGAELEIDTSVGSGTRIVLRLNTPKGVMDMS